MIPLKGEISNQSFFDKPDYTLESLPGHAASRRSPCGPLNPFYAGGHGAIGIKLKPAITGRYIIDLGIWSIGFELHAGGWCRQ